MITTALANSRSTELNKILQDGKTLYEKGRKATTEAENKKVTFCSFCSFGSF